MNRIRCREFDELVHGLVRLELLDITLREEALAHAARCANCAERMSAARVLAETTEALADMTRGEVTRGDVKNVLVAEFRSRRRRQVWWHVFEWSTAGAVAAMGLFLIWSVYGRSPVPSSAPRKDVSSQLRQPQEAAVSSDDALSQQVATGESTDFNTEVASDAGEVDANATDFVPVPYATGLDPQESGMIVRVQLTPDSLAELGYPVAAVSSDDLIRADVLVGEDGWPRAVQLVQ